MKKGSKNKPFVKTNLVGYKSHNTKLSSIHFQNSSYEKKHVNTRNVNLKTQPPDLSLFFSVSTLFLRAISWNSDTVTRKDPEPKVRFLVHESCGMHTLRGMNVKK